MSRASGLAILVAHLVMGCRPDPVLGEPCNEGDPQDVTVFGGGGPGAGGTYLVLDCGAPPGCEGDEPFSWQVSGQNRTWCGCDGVTHHPRDADFGSIPTTRWRYYGWCEEPCREVWWNRGEWVFNGGLSLTPIAPECAECQDAMMLGTRCVDGPTGDTRPIECCRCTNATLSPDGRCIDGAEGHEIAATCCG